MTLADLRLGQVLFVLLFYITLSYATLQNVTVDDAAVTGVIPQYLPSAGWTQGATCTGCFAHPDPSQAFNGTWHDSTFTPSDGVAKAVEFTFTGSAIYIYFILANTIKFTDTLTNMNFILDDVSVGTFEHSPSSSTDFEYNVPVYVNEVLSFAQHHMRMEAVGNRSALILFDYLVYTTETDDTTSTSSPSATSASVSASDDTTSTSGTSSLATSAVISSSDGITSSIASLKTTLASVPLLVSTGTDETPSSTFSLSTTLASASASETPPTSSRLRIAPVIGGTIAGVVSAFSLMVALFCFRKHGRRDRGMTQLVHDSGFSPSDSIPGNAVVEPGTSHDQPMMVSSIDTPPSSHQFQSSKTVSTTKQSQAGPRQANPAQPATGQSTAIASMQPTGAFSPVGASAGGTAVLREQVELLMDEVARLRLLHLQDPNAYELESEALPGYSEGGESPHFSH